MNRNHIKAHLIEENVFIVYMHNSILQSALPSAFGTRHLPQKMHDVNNIAREYNIMDINDACHGIK